MNRFITVLGAILLYGSASSSEWKVFSFATNESDNILLFYDPSSVKQTENDFITVRVKSMDAALLLGAEISNEGLARIDAKLKSGYIPPITMLTSTSVKGGLILEEQANNAGVPAINQLVWEIDCTKGVERILSAAKMADNEQASYEVFPDWERVPPGSVGNNLMRLLCS